MKSYVIAGLVWVLFLWLFVYFFPSTDRIRAGYTSQIEKNIDQIEALRQERYQAEKDWKEVDDSLSGAINALKTENLRLDSCKESVSFDCNQATSFILKANAEEDSEIPNPSACKIGSGSHDVRPEAYYHPGVAGWKNNNPSGITLWSKALEQAFTDAGIAWFIGSARPANEGSFYYAFPDLENGMRAKLLIIRRSYQNSTIATYLARWGTDTVVTSLDTSRTIDSLSESELLSLAKAQIRKESGDLADYIFENVIECKNF